MRTKRQSVAVFPTPAPLKKVAMVGGSVGTNSSMSMLSNGIIKIDKNGNEVGKMRVSIKRKHRSSRPVGSARGNTDIVDVVLRKNDVKASVRDRMMMPDNHGYQEKEVQCGKKQLERGLGQMSGMSGKLAASDSYGPKKVLETVVKAEAAEARVKAKEAQIENLDLHISSTTEQQEKNHSSSDGKEDNLTEKPEAQECEPGELVDNSSKEARTEIDVRATAGKSTAEKRDKTDGKGFAIGAELGDNPGKDVSTESTIGATTGESIEENRETLDGREISIHGEPDTSGGPPPLQFDPRFAKYFSMLRAGVPRKWVRKVMESDGKDSKLLDLNPRRPLVDQVAALSSAFDKVNDKNECWPSKEGADIDVHQRYGALISELQAGYLKERSKMQDAISKKEEECNQLKSQVAKLENKRGRFSGPDEVSLIVQEYENVILELKEAKLKAYTQLRTQLLAKDREIDELKSLLNKQVRERSTTRS